MKILVTGGAGFIGRWLVKRLLDDNHQVWVLDNLANGQVENIEAFLEHPSLKGFVQGDIKDTKVLEELFLNQFELCFHLAASINVQDSIDDPRTTFENDVLGTFNVLESCRKYGTKMVFMSTCMVYDRAGQNEAIDEMHPTKPASPYAGSKIAGENLVLSFWHAYKLPVVVVRPFNTYGPFQKSSGEGGVVAIFIQRELSRLPLNIYGDGMQTRDLLYVEDCAEFLMKAGFSKAAEGEIINAGSGRDISINQLAFLIAGNEEKIKHVPHIHPQSEIQKLLCSSKKAEDLLGWEAKTTLEEGIARTREWIINRK
ncbi:MAG: GDP-mannose 4,6-dehydratase [Clostridia bacterium]|nr:GDP-mannose 4,6-dehydratase [Clostridia bacterium]